jgi:hypothetical protein
MNRVRTVLQGVLVLGWIPTLVVAGGARWFVTTPYAAERTPVQVTRMYTGADGKTHAEDITIPLGELRNASERSATTGVTGLQFVRTSTAYDLDWHTAPRRQYVVTVSGESEVIIGDGTKIHLYPGKIMLAEDTTGQGHISKSIGGKDRISLFIPLADNK